MGNSILLNYSDKKLNKMALPSYNEKENRHFYRRHTTGDHLINDFWLEKEYLPFFNTNILHLIGYGESIYKPGGKVSFCHPYWSLQFITAGTSQVKYGGTTRKVSPGDFVLVRPGVPFTYFTPDDSRLSKKAILVSNGQMMSLLCGNGALAREEVFHLPAPLKFQQLYEEIKKFILEDTSPYPAQKLSGFVYLFMMELIAQTGSEGSSDDFNAIAKSIGANLREPYSLASLSAQYNIGERTMTRLFLKNFKRTPIQYIIDLRMKYAVRMLSLNTSTVKDIASDCGFNSVSYFIRTFKKHFGVSPCEYRKTHLVDEKDVKRKHRRECSVGRRPG